MLLSVLLALTVIMVTARIVGAIFSKLNQPAVIGEVVGGILLGPSLLGRFAPQAQAFLLPPSAAPMLNVIAQIGVILYVSASCFICVFCLNPWKARFSGVVSF